ncbi:MAG TPA: HAMP domain-containing sensor histidine kinase [Burkholderiaceae bacterium]|nr:HAMP domain-containing sensor histidine kinase [Burkholderiaceae bacterium]
MQNQPFFDRLYVRIWVAVVVAVAVLILMVGLAWRESAERKSAEFSSAMLVRELIIKNEAGDEIGRTKALPRAPAMPLEFTIQLSQAVPAGSSITAELPRPQRVNPETGALEPLRPFNRNYDRNLERPNDNVRDRLHERMRDRKQDRDMSRTGPPANASWFTPPFGFVWMLGLVGIAVALGTYPVIRRLTKRLNNLQRGVEQWGQGDLSTRVEVSGKDEVAFLAERFNTAASRIEALVSSHKSLLANASHELRSPLTRIRMSIELMGSHADNPAQTRLKDEIARNINELDALIAEILLASRLDSASADVGTFEKVDLIGMAAEECALTGADLDVQGTTEVVVQGVPKLLRRVMRNLLENANRYAKPQSTTQNNATNTATTDQERVQLSLALADKMAIICVTDHGPGVPVELRERIFEPFFRAPGASEREGGVGLGLSLVKSIATRHGGSVRCEAGANGKGASFVVTLPL